MSKMPKYSDSLPEAAQELGVPFRRLQTLRERREIAPTPAGRWNMQKLAEALEAMPRAGKRPKETAKGASLQTQKLAAQVDEIRARTRNHTLKGSILAGDSIDAAETRRHLNLAGKILCERVLAVADSLPDRLAHRDAAEIETELRAALSDALSGVKVEVEKALKKAARDSRKRAEDELPDEAPRRGRRGSSK